MKRLTYAGAEEVTIWHYIFVKMVNICPNFSSSRDIQILFSNKQTLHCLQFVDDFTFEHFPYPNKLNTTTITTNKKAGKINPNFISQFTVILLKKTVFI